MSCLLKLGHQEALALKLTVGLELAELYTSSKTFPACSVAAEISAARAGLPTYWPLLTSPCWSGPSS